MELLNVKLLKLCFLLNIDYGCFKGKYFLLVVDKKRCMVI